MSMEVADGLLLASGIVLSLFISMIVLNRVLPSTAARWAKAALSVVAIASMVDNSPGDLDDIWFFSVEILALLSIIGLAWTWRSDPAERSLDPVVASETQRSQTGEGKRRTSSAIRYTRVLFVTRPVSQAWMRLHWDSSRSVDTWTTSDGGGAPQLRPDMKSGGLRRSRAVIR